MNTIFKIINSQFSQLLTKGSRLNHSSCKHSALSCALVFYSVFSCPSSHIFKTGRLIGTEIYGTSMEFLGGEIADVSPAKSTAIPSFRFLCGGRVRQWWRWGWGGGGETAVSDGYTAKLVPALPHSLTTTPAICSSAHLQTARHRSTEDKVRWHLTSLWQPRTTPLSTARSRYGSL